MFVNLSAVSCAVVRGPGCVNLSSSLKAKGSSGTKSPEWKTEWPVYGIAGHTEDRRGHLQRTYSEQRGSWLVGQVRS